MFDTVWPVAVVAAEFLAKLVLITFILLRRPARATNLAWVVVIMLVPLFGMVAYLLVGETRLSRRRIRRHAEILEHLHQPLSLESARSPAAHPVLDEAQRPIATLAESVGANRPLGGNELLLLGEKESLVNTLVADIDAATRYCHILSYIYLDDSTGCRVGEALMAAAQRGLACRLLVDAVGSSRFARSPLRRRMEEAGVKVVEALPATAVRMLFARLDLRNHRKIAVIDGAIGYMGSQNIADAAFALKPRFAPWVDASVRVSGPATHDLALLFAEDWYLDTKETLDPVPISECPPHPDGVVTQIMGTGPNSFNEALRQLIVSAVHTAREEIIITTPYLVPDDATATALRTAARRGVETTLVVPARNDSPFVAAASRSFYGLLLNAGVRIMEYQRGLLHAKTLTFDRDLALISSANLDRRSFELNFEVSMLVYDTDFASELRFLQTSYIEDSRAVEPLRWGRRPWPVRLCQNAAGMLGPIL